MANEEYLAKLREGVEAWNRWREMHPDIEPDLSDFKPDLSTREMLDLLLEGLSLGIDLAGANLANADLSKALLHEADLTGANLTGARLSEADLSEAKLDRADLTQADLSGADLSRSVWIETNLTGAVLEGCRIYGISVWDLQTSESTRTLDLIITPVDQPAVTADDLEVAQFVYLMLKNYKIRNVLSTIGKKGVLILGRFTPERKEVLEALREDFENLITFR